MIFDFLMADLKTIIEILPIPLPPNNHLCLIFLFWKTSGFSGIKTAGIDLFIIWDFSPYAVSSITNTVSWVDAAKTTPAGLL